MSTCWCAPNEISPEWIEERISDGIMNLEQLDTIYMSQDVYAEFQKQQAGMARYSGVLPHGVPIAGVVTSAGSLRIKQVPHLSNFCHVGTQTSFEQLEWIKIGQEFEKVFFGDEQ